MSRSSWKLNFIHPQARQNRQNNTTSEIVLQNRATVISEKILNRVIQVYNGTRWYQIEVTPEKIGHRVGEFAPTRKRPIPKKKKQTKK